MRAFRFISVGLMAAVTVACSGPTGPVFDKVDTDSITKLIQELVVAYNAKDAAKAAALYSGNAVVMPPNTSLMRGRPAVEQYYIGRFAEGASDLTMEPKDIGGYGTLGYASGDYRLNFVAKEGGQDRRDRGKFVWIFREFDGRWMIEYVIFSSDFAPPPAA